jgi:hypothetical protein
MIKYYITNYKYNYILFYHIFIININYYSILLYNKKDKKRIINASRKMKLKLLHGLGAIQSLNILKKNILLY